MGKVEEYNTLPRKHGESLTDWTLRWLQSQGAPFTVQQRLDDQRRIDDLQHSKGVYDDDNS